MDLIALRSEAAGLGQVRARTLVIVSDLDAPMSISSGQALAAGIPGARRVLMEGTAHLPNVEQPERFNREVLAFLSGASEES